jgi:hypothetical protein
MSRSTVMKNDDLSYFFQVPQEVPPDYLDEICKLVEAGGSVKSKWVRYNLERAFLLTYVLDQSQIIACSSLKYPRPEYIQSVKDQCGLDLTNFLERGYTSVIPEYRGLGIASKLLAGLTTRIGEKKLYSVIGEDNIGGQKIALNNNTKCVAVYSSKLSGKKIGIWIPEWMIETERDPH